MVGKYLLGAFVSGGIGLVGSARSAEPHPKEPLENGGFSDARPVGRLSVMAGMGQWLLLRGGNLALEYKTRRLVFGASHGQGLDLNQVGGAFLSPGERDAGARLRTPWTTGFGIGSRVTENLHFLVEFKAHRYEVLTRDRADRAVYTTFSVGPGVFYSVFLHKGLFLQPNVRWWPNVGSTLPHGRVLLRQGDGGQYEHRAHVFGLFANLNLGYSF